MIYFFNRVVFSCDVRPNQYLHSTVEFPHNALGVVIHVNSQIHENVKILHQVTLGGVGGKFGQYNNKKIDALCVKFM
jgi:serine acetyltransferase